MPIFGQRNSKLNRFSRQKRKESKQYAKQMKNIESLVNNVETNMKSLYADTYLSDRSNLDSLDHITNSIEDNINAIIKRNSKYDISNTSRLYARLMRKNSSIDRKSDINFKNDLEELFGDSSFTDAVFSMYMSNKWIADLEQEIDTLLRYLPNLREALDVLKDAVLSADSVSKEFIYPKVAISDDTDLKIVIDRISRMAEKYELPNRIEEWYDLASKYGEAFVYQVPYNKALTKLLNSRERANSTINTTLIENGVINESAIEGSFKNLDLGKECSLEVQIDTSGILESVINESTLRRKSRSNATQGLMESYMDEIKNKEVVQEKTKLDKVIPDDIQIPDGLNDTNSYSSKNMRVDNDKVDVKGCVIKTLIRTNLIRLYVDDICLGYYYLEFNGNQKEMSYSTNSDAKLGYSSSGSSITSIEKTITDKLGDSKVDHLMKTIAKQMSDQLDSTFINANQDLTKEIYAILKYNDVFNSNTQMRVSFLPPEDVKWLRFREEDHIGISDINDSLVPAKMLAMLQTDYVIGTLTRGQDKRVYYVKQTVETNIAQTLLNVINQIKKSNFNMRSIENINNLLNITGKFNDYIIPVGPSGDSPIQFEVMPGQQYDINQDMTNMLEEATINPIVPMEVVQMRMNPEFATQYTSASLKLLRKTYRRQARLEIFISSIYTDGYATEYDEFQQIDCELPPPVFLSMINTNQILENAKQYAETIGELEYASETSDTMDQEKAIFIKKLIRSMVGSYIRPSEIDKHKSAAKFEVAKQRKSEEA